MAGGDLWVTFLTPISDGVPERAGAEPELDPPAGQDVERRGAAGRARPVAAAEIRDVRDDRDPFGAGSEVREQRPGVEERRLVGVVLHADGVQAEQVGLERGGQHLVVPGRVGRDEDAEVQVVPAVHGGILARPQSPTRGTGFATRARGRSIP
jgi:hypothetical protein